MNEIKVRMWSGAVKKYFYGEEALKCLLGQNRFNENKALGYDFISYGFCFEQYTGYQDMYKNDIYRGDRIKLNYGIPLV